jgi:type II secretion system (T2SS) protein G
MHDRAGWEKSRTDRGVARGSGPVALPVLFMTALLLLACGKTGENAAHEVLHAIDQGKIVGTRGTMENIGKALTTYSIDRGEYPRGMSLQEATVALVPAFLPSAVTVDAWGNTLVYQSDTKSFTLTSPGADGRVGTADDMVMTDGRFTQLPAPGAQ